MLRPERRGHGAAKSVRRYWETEQWRIELAELNLRFPQLSAEYDATTGVMVLTGRLPVTPDVGYSVTIKLGPDYPDVAPTVRCDPREIEPIPDRHVPQAKLACAFAANFGCIGHVAVTSPILSSSW